MKIIGFIYKRRWTFFILFCFGWAIWGSWELIDFLISKTSLFSSLNEKFRNELQQSEWYTRIFLGFGFILTTIFWITLPLQLLSIIIILFEKNKSFKEKMKSIFFEYFGSLFGMFGLLTIWLIMTFAFYSGLLELLFIMGITGYIIYLIFMLIKGKAYSLFKKK